MTVWSPIITSFFQGWFLWWEDQITWDYGLITYYRQAKTVIVQEAEPHWFHDVLFPIWTIVLVDTAFLYSRVNISIEITSLQAEEILLFVDMRRGLFGGCLVIEMKIVMISQPPTETNSFSHVCVSSYKLGNASSMVPYNPISLKLTCLFTVPWFCDMLQVTYCPSLMLNSANLGIHTW